jgi:hypothetical protein
VTRTIPADRLSPKEAPETLVVATPFPPDDGSAGYARGTSVSKAWEQAVTVAAVEGANKVAQRFDDLTNSKRDAGDRAEKLKTKVLSFSARSPASRFELVRSSNRWATLLAPSTAATVTACSQALETDVPRA